MRILLRALPLAALILGLAVFGFPLAAQAEELVEGRPLQVQWFERDRLELQPVGCER